MEKGINIMDKDIVGGDYAKYIKELQNEVLAKGLVGIGDITMLNPLVFAYIGDSVYELFVRSLLISRGITHVSKLHKKSIDFVKAKSQADILERLMGNLTDEEADIVRRGRNAKSGSVPKNAEICDYKYATGFEALIGFLYLTGRTERLKEIMQLILEIKNDII